MELILIQNGPQFWNECLTCYCAFDGSVFKSVQWGEKKPLMCSQYGTSATIEELKNPALAGKKRFMT